LIEQANLEIHTALTGWDPHSANATFHSTSSLIIRLMPRVRMFVQEWPTGYSVLFTEEHNSSIQVGRHYEYTHSDRLYEILRASHAPLEDHQALEYGLAARAVACVILNLNDEQYAKLKRRASPS